MNNYDVRDVLKGVVAQAIVDWAKGQRLVSRTYEEVGNRTDEVRRTSEGDKVEMTNVSQGQDSYEVTVTVNGDLVAVVGQAVDQPYASLYLK